MKKDIAKYRSPVFLIGLFVFLVHGSKLNSRNIGIDTEDMIRLQKDFYAGWEQSGRQGLVLSKRLLGTFDFNPYFAGLLTLLLLGAAVAAFLLLWDGIWREAFGARPAAQKAAKREGRSLFLDFGWLFAGFLWISHPVMTEQLYFSLQSLEISAGLLLTAVSLHLARKGIQEHRISCLAGCFLLLLLLFSMYQIFVVLYVFGVLSMLVLQFAGEWRQAAAGKIWRGVFAHGGLFLAAFGMNLIITGAFYSAGSDYLSGQVQWGRVSLQEGILRILDHGFRVCTGWNALYYNAGFGLLSLAALLLALRSVCRPEGGNRGTGVLWLLLLAALMSTPFWMTFLCAGAPVVRSQLVLPAVTGFLAYFVCRMCGEAGEHWMWLRRLLAGGLILALWCQVQTTLRLYYTDDCRYEQDAALGRDMITALEQLENGESSGLVVVGSRPFAPNNACVLGETIGRSFFDYDTQAEPECYWSTRRVVGFLHTLGYEIGHASRENCRAAVADSAGKPIWPQEGSVWRMGSSIVLKLSECS